MLEDISHLLDNVSKHEGLQTISSASFDDKLPNTEQYLEVLWATLHHKVALHRVVSIKHDLLHLLTKIRNTELVICFCKFHTYKGVYVKAHYQFQSRISKAVLERSRLPV